MVLQSVKNIVKNTQWKMHDFDSEYVFSTSSVKYVVENERSLRYVMPLRNRIHLPNIQGEKSNDFRL